MVANILAPIIIRLFDAGLADLVEPNGEIILSGILAHQAENVIEAAQAKGLKRNDQRQIADWVAISLKDDFNFQPATFNFFVLSYEPSWTVANWFITCF